LSAGAEFAVLGAMNEGEVSSLEPATIAEPSFSSQFKVRATATLLVFGALVAYHNSLRGPFVFDDVGVIEKNLTIRSLWPIWNTFAPPIDGSPVTGRPLVNFTLALNYAFSGASVGGYHLLNLLIHLLAGLTLFGIVRRTVRLRVGDAAALPLAFGVAWLWTLHPLQTEAVNYVVQRAESLAGLCYLLTLYCFIRGAVPPAAGEGGGPPAGRWFKFSVAACLAGMASKEVVVSAPLIVLLYDRAFLAGSFRRAWIERGRVYAGLAATWLLLLVLVIRAGSRGGSAGFGTEVAWPDYALTQLQALPHYLRLSLWPDPLVFDYGTGVVRYFVDVAWQGGVVLLLVVGAAIALWQNTWVGFLGAWFFAVLAPSSSVVPVVTQTMAEHRMYLALAALAMLVVLGLQAVVGRRSVAIVAGLGLLLGWGTVRRNEDYRSAEALWRDTAVKVPGNARAHYNLANALVLAGRAPDAVREFETAVRLNPKNLEGQNNLGVLLAESGRVPEAMAHFAQAVRLKPDDAESQLNLANTLFQLGRLPEAIGYYEQALRLNPALTDARDNLQAARRELSRGARRP